MSTTLQVETSDSSKFHVRGPDWSFRLNSFFSEVPKCALLLDAVVEENGAEMPVQLFCQRDLDGLTFSGDWQAMPRI